MKGAKTSVQTAASGLLIIALERLTAGEVYQGGAAFAAAVGLFYAYEYLNLKQLPVTSEDVTEFTDAVGDAAEERADSLRDRRGR